ncbi:hypothetical protein HN51_040244, partial [Arachis hypogaea]
RHSSCCPSRGSGRRAARLSLSRFCSPLPARLIPSTVAVPGSPIPSLAVTLAVARSPPRNSPVTRSRTPKPSPVVLLGTHPSPVVLHGSCSRYRPPRTTALMLASSEHLRDNYSLATNMDPNVPAQLFEYDKRF